MRVMMRICLAILTVGTCVLTLGCNAVQIGELDSDLNEAHFRQQMLEEEPSPKKRAAQSEEVRLRFIQVKQAALDAASRETNPKAKISNYRTAATAAWQARDPETAKISADGAAFCMAHDGYSIAPRDCSLLASVPDLATNDVAIAGLRKKRARAADYRQVFEDLSAAYTTLGAHIERAGASDVSPEYITMLTGRRSKVGANISVLTRDARRTSREDRGATFAGMCRDIRELSPPVKVPPTCK